MIHHYDLNPGPFWFMKNKKKDIEMRVNDEKRQLLNIGDLIIFRNNETDELIKVEIINLYHFPTFKEIYEHFVKCRLGYNEEEVAKYEDMYEYYTKEKIEKYGALGIEIKLMEE